MCRDEMNNCHFGEKCWFLHMPSGNEIEYQNGKNQNYLEKLFDMVEKFTNRIVLIENRMNGQMIWYFCSLTKIIKEKYTQVKIPNQKSKYKSRKIVKRTNSVFEGCNYRVSSKVCVKKFDNPSAQISILSSCSIFIILLNLYGFEYIYGTI